MVVALNYVQNDTAPTGQTSAPAEAQLELVGPTAADATILSVTDADSPVQVWLLVNDY